MDIRKNFLTVFGDLKIIHVKNPLSEDFNGQAPTGINGIGRIRYLTQNVRLSLKDTLEKVALELFEIWIYGLNIYPMTKTNIITKLNQVYMGVKAKYGSNSTIKAIYGFRPLLHWGKNRRDSKWKERVMEMSEMLQTGFDLKTNNDTRIKIQEKIHLVKMTEDEIKLYEDNCKIKASSCPWNIVIKCKECPRQIFSSKSVDKKWQKWKSRKL